MEEKDLDHILLDQLHAAKRTKKTIKRLKGLLPCDSGLYMIESQNVLRVQFFESMIKDKSFIHKKPAKKGKPVDILSKNPLIEAYKYTMFISVYSYTIVSEYIRGYTSYFRKDSNEKDTNN